MPKNKTKMMWGIALIVLGLLVVLGTHTFMLFALLTDDQQMPHAIINLLAGVMITISVFMGR